MKKVLSRFFIRLIGKELLKDGIHIHKRLVLLPIKFFKRVPVIAEWNVFEMT